MKLEERLAWQQKNIAKMKENNISALKMAQAMGSCYPRMTEWVNGKRVPTASTLYAWTAALDMILLARTYDSLRGTSYKKTSINQLPK